MPPPAGQPFPPPPQQYPPPPSPPFQNPSYAQPYPAYPQQQPYAAPPAAPPAKKKKRTGLKVLLGFVGAIALLVTAIILIMGKASRMDYYKILHDQVPSVKYVLGEKRKVITAGAETKNGISSKYFEYKSDTPQEDKDTYFASLLEKEGFIKLVDPDTMEAVGVGRNSVEPGHHIEVVVEPASDGYIVKVYYVDGELEMINTSTDDGPDPYDTPYSDDDETTAPAMTYQSPATQAATQGGASSGMGSLTKSIFSAFGSGTYHLKTRTKDVVSEMYAKGGATAMKVNAEGTDMRIVYKDGKAYTIMEAQKMVMVSDIPAGTETPASVPDTNALTYVGEGSGEFDGGTYRYEEYKNTNGDQMFYFVDGSTWKGTRSVINGATHDMVVLAFDTNVPDDVFEIPSDYTMLSN